MLPKYGCLQFGTLYFTLAGIWNLPCAEQVVGTITAIDTFLGCILGISTLEYNRKQAEFNRMNGGEE